MDKFTGWSYSSLTSFENCPRQYQKTRVTKEVKDLGSDATREGTRVHLALEERVRDGKPLPPDLQKHEDMAQSFANFKGDVYTEIPLAVDANLMYVPVEMVDGKPDWPKNAWCKGIIDLLAVKRKSAFNADYKGLDIDTEIPTPDGFTMMRDLRVGHTVFGGDGKECTIKNKSQVHNRPCFRVEFDDKTSVVCDNEHLWKLHDGAVVPVTELKKNQKVLLAGVVDYKTEALPLDPYVLGLWLADGKHTSSEITKPDNFVWEEIQRRGYDISHDYSAKAKNGKCRVHTVKGIRGVLDSLGMLGNKHIPAMYMRADKTQRLDLLRGLMDGDGSVNSVRNQAVFSTCSKALALQVKQLLASLGQRVNMADVEAKGFGLTVRAYPLAFRPQHINPFLLPRKAAKVLETWGLGHSWYRRVVKVSPVASVQTQCIEVDSKDNTYLCTRDFIPTHNTGKVKPESKQLMLSSALVFAAFEDIQVINTSFLWLKFDKSTDDTFERGQTPFIWQTFLPRVQRLERAYKEDKWLPKPSGLCGWCPCTKAHCEFAKK